VPFVDVGSRRVPDVLAEVQADSSSVGLGWRDLFVVSGASGCEADDVTVGGHHFVLNTDRAPQDLRVKVGRAFVRKVVVPGEMWFCPAREAFTHRAARPARFVQVTLDPARFARDVAGDPLALRRAYGGARPQLGHLVRSLAAEAEQGGPSGPLFLDALTTALVTQLAACFGTCARPAVPAQALGTLALRRVLSFVHENLGTALSVEQMAEQHHEDGGPRRLF
jgi:AraC family transcriptional regulator